MAIHDNSLLAVLEEGFNPSDNSGMNTINLKFLQKDFVMHLVTDSNTSSK